MNDEIKEILEYFKDDIDYLEEELKYPNFKGRYITIRDKEYQYLRKLLDYITNLQEENKRLIKKLISYNMSGEVPYLNYEKIAEDYKSRNEKAIEYIELRRYSNEDGKPSLDLDEYDCVPLLNILQGVSNENSNE